MEALSINPRVSRGARRRHAVIKIQNESAGRILRGVSERFVAFASVALQFRISRCSSSKDGVKKLGLRGAASARA